MARRSVRAGCALMLDRDVANLEPVTQQRIEFRYEELLIVRAVWSNYVSCQANATAC